MQVTLQINRNDGEQPLQEVTQHPRQVRAYIFALAVSKKRSAELLQDVTVSTSK
jgi:hypothetical protein